MNKDQLRQGDVFLHRRHDIDVDKMLQDSNPEKTKQGKHILAEGESTGHAHRIQQGAQEGAKTAMMMMGDLRLLHVPAEVAPVTLTHEEHGPIVVGEGVWEIKQQRQFIGNEARPVLD